MTTQIILVFLLAAGTAMANRDDNGDRRPPPPSPKEFIEKLDLDGDGKVSKAEFDGPVEHFIDCDENEDGYITLDEAPDGPPPPPPQDR